MFSVALARLGVAADGDAGEGMMSKLLRGVAAILFVTVAAVGMGAFLADFAEYMARVLEVSERVAYVAMTVIWAGVALTVIAEDMRRGEE